MKSQASNAKFPQLAHPLAITMWDFSWLERRWPGAGFEDWDRALDDLAERGYNAVRIDAYPHLVAEDPERSWELLPVWSTQDWGSPARNRVQVVPALHDFLSKCAERNIGVGLSTWFREDTEHVRDRILTPEHHAQIWIQTLESIRSAGLLDAVVYLDLCNEWTHPAWSSFFRPPNVPLMDWTTPSSTEWMRRAMKAIRQKFPQIPLAFSVCTQTDAFGSSDHGGWDFAEPHIWMASSTDFYDRIGYTYEFFSLGKGGYETLVQRGESLYRKDPAYWQGLLREKIHAVAAASEFSGLPVATTECWGVVDFKDWSLLDWGWVKELCETGVAEAVATGRWCAIATSNFCSPQFVGMWRDVAWHQRLTGMIRNAQTKFAPHSGREQT